MTPITEKTFTPNNDSVKSGSRNIEKKSKFIELKLETVLKPTYNKLNKEKVVKKSSEKVARTFAGSRKTPRKPFLLLKYKCL